MWVNVNHKNVQFHTITDNQPSKRRRQWHPTPVLLPGKSHGQRSLVGCSPWVREESDTTEQPHFHFSVSCIGEGNGNPLQCSCLENPRDRGAWWAAVSGVAQSRTWLKQLSSSSSSNPPKHLKKPQCFYFLAVLHSMWDLSSSSTDWTHTLCSESWNLNHWTTREILKHSWGHWHQEHE